jgi:hypothetical protein
MLFAQACLTEDEVNALPPIRWTRERQLTSADNGMGATLSILLNGFAEVQGVDYADRVRHEFDFGKCLLLTPENCLVGFGDLRWLPKVPEQMIMIKPNIGADLVARVSSLEQVALPHVPQNVQDLLERLRSALQGRNCRFLFAFVTNHLLIFTEAGSSGRIQIALETVDIGNFSFQVGRVLAGVGVLCIWFIGSLCQGQCTCDAFFYGLRLAGLYTAVWTPGLNGAVSCCRIALDGLKWADNPLREASITSRLMRLFDWAVSGGEDPTVDELFHQVLFRWRVVKKMRIDYMRAASLDIATSFGVSVREANALLVLLRGLTVGGRKVVVRLWKILNQPSIVEGARLLREMAAVLCRAPNLEACQAIVRRKSKPRPVIDSALLILSEVAPVFDEGSIGECALRLVNLIADRSLLNNVSGAIRACFRPCVADMVSVFPLDGTLLMADCRVLRSVLGLFSNKPAHASAMVIAALVTLVFKIYQNESDVLSIEKSQPPRQRADGVVKSMRVSRFLGLVDRSMLAYSDVPDRAFVFWDELTGGFIDEGEFKMAPAPAPECKKSVSGGRVWTEALSDAMDLIRPYVNANDFNAVTDNQAPPSCFATLLGAADKWGMKGLYSVPTFDNLKLISFVVFRYSHLLDSVLMALRRDA